MRRRPNPNNKEEASKPLEKRPVPPKKLKKKTNPDFWSNLCYKFFVFLVGYVILTLSFLVGVTLRTSPIDAVSFSLDPAPEIEFDNRLSKSEILLPEQVYGPETLAIHPKTKKLYMGLKTGLICEVEVNKSEVKILRSIALSQNTCDGSYANMASCGRPLGLRFTPDGVLLVADAYLGLFSIDLENEKVYNLFPGGAQLEEPEQPPLRALNDLDVLPDGRIVLSESSNKFDDRDFIYDVFEHRPNGRVVVYDPSTKNINLLAENLFFPNGIQVWEDKILIAEMGMCRLLKLSPSTRQLSVVSFNLPGYPDNIRPAKDGGVWVALPSIRTSSDDWISERPKLREYITKIFRADILQSLVEASAPDVTAAIRIDPKTGNVLETLTDHSGAVTAVTTVIEDNEGNLYMGNDGQYYIARYKR